MRDHITRLITIFTAAYMSFSISGAHAGEIETDPVDPVTEDVEQPQPKEGSWVKQLIQNGFHINDPSINYPKFPRFCLKIYNWGDKTFNSYDPEYVVSTGKNWKLRGNSQNWAQTYVMQFEDNSRSRMIMSSDVYSDLGGYISFMAVSVGYSVNARQLFNSTRNSRNHFAFNFVCSRFSANYAHYSTDGGVHIHRFGDFNDGKHISYPFNDIHHTTTQGNIYYFFNHRRYAQAAAYAYSKYQLKSAGSWIAGVSVTGQKINMDFSSLPEEMRNHLPSLTNLVYNFHSTDYNILGGYGYNWVLSPKKWLINITCLPSIGLKHSYEDATDGRKNLFSGNINSMGSVVYNHRSLFVSLYGTFEGRLYFNKSLTFFNSQESLNLNVGLRF